MDAKIAELVSNELSRDTVVVFDEAHNIDQVCIDGLSVTLTRKTLDSSSRSLESLSRRLQEKKEADIAKLQNEYETLLAGLRRSRPSPIHTQTDVLIGTGISKLINTI